MKRFLLLNILTFTVLFAFSQITIRGTFTYHFNTEPEKVFPASGEMVFIAGTNVTTFTDRNGNFQLRYYGSENDTIKISYLDFDNKVRTIKVSDDNLSDYSDKIYTINVCLVKKTYIDLNLRLEQMVPNSAVELPRRRNIISIPSHLINPR